MIKNNKLKTLITSIIILIPAILGLIFYNKLPNMLTIHWSADGTPDGTAGKLFAILFIPIFLLAMHLVCLAVTGLDKRATEQNPKILGLMFYVCPAISLIASSCIYVASAQIDINMKIVLAFLLGITFIIIGNYMPKTRQNFFLGVKLPWTLSSEANWNATHRLCGKLWVAGGFLFIPAGLLPDAFFIAGLFALIIFMTVPVTIYSYKFYKKELSEGKDVKPLSYAKAHKKATIITVVFLVVTFIFVGILMFTGDIEYVLTDKTITAKADFYGDITINLADIESAELIEDANYGTRSFGYASARLLLGSFENEEYGDYTLYAYAGTDTAILINHEMGTIVFSAKTAEETKNLYEDLSSKLK